MPSKAAALALVAMVLLSGCSMLDGGDPAPTSMPDPGNSHALVYGSDTGGHAYEATVTVTKDGETVYETDIESNGTGVYRNLTRFEEPGPYTVTVNTTLPAPGFENRSERFEVGGKTSEATAISVGYQGIAHATFALPRRSVDEPIEITGTGPGRSVDRLVVEHRGRRVVETAPTLAGNEPYYVANLERTGVYRVSVLSEGEWERRTVVLADPSQQVHVILGYQQSPAIVVESADG